MFAILLGLVAVLNTIKSVVRIITTFAPDFSIFYQSTLDLLRHVNPYTDKTLYTLFSYPPVTTLLFIPLSILPYKLAQSIFIIMSALSGLGIVYISLKIIRKKVAL